MAYKFLNGLDVASQRIQNLADASSATDAVTLQQLQAMVRGLAWKSPGARAASTTNVTLTAPGATMDGVTLVSGDRVLLKNQTTGSENGVYVWTGSGATLTRATDVASAAQLSAATILVTEGTTNADKAWTQTADAITVGTTALVWAPFGGGGATYTAGNGLQLSSLAFSVLLDTASGLIVSGTGLKVDGSVLVKKYAVTIGDGSSTSIAVTHNLGTQDITWSIRDASTNAIVDTDAVVTSVNVLTLTFGAAPASSAFRVTVHG
jgi:hypothetical protein